MKAARLLVLPGWIAAFSGVQAAAPVVPLTDSLVFTSTQRMGYYSSAGNAPVADTETVYAVKDVQPDAVQFGFYISSGTGAMNDILRKVPREFTRTVRRADLDSAARVSITFSSDDPEMLPGQTFAGTSAAVIKALQTQGQVAFVLGVNEPDAGFGGLASLGGAVQGSGTGGLPAMVGGFMTSLGVSRHYYRGTLKRVGAGDEPFSVLVNGRRTDLPAMHARGEMTFTDKTLTPELWWLDEPGNPMMLKWKVGEFYELVTRIDYAAGSGSGAAGAGGGGGGGGSADGGLGGKDCRAELSGVYFTTGSAVVLDASLPALQRFAAVMAAHPDWMVTVEGHTDNIGSAPYNMDLSSARANAVREVLVTRFRVPASRLQAKGYGLTRPVETNATEQGRAHNRRVEVSRSCH
jgi:OmpA family